MTDMLSAAFCSKCGRAIPPEAEFCAGCGTRMPLRFDTPSCPRAPLRPADGSGHESCQIRLPSAATVRRRVTVVDSGVGGADACHAGDGQFPPGDRSALVTRSWLLGTGGMGAVYQAFDHELGVGVAIKVIRPAAQPMRPRRAISNCASSASSCSRARSPTNTSSASTTSATSTASST